MNTDAGIEPKPLVMPNLNPQTLEDAANLAKWAFWLSIAGIAGSWLWLRR